MSEIVEPTAVKSDKKLVVSGIFWTLIQLAVNQSFSFVLKLILAKLLFPNQFGLVGMAAVFTGFVQVLNDLGVGAALVQRKKEDLRPEHYSTAFTTGVIWSVLLFAIMSLAVAPIAANFYHEPLLRTIVPVLSIGILFSPVNLVHKAQLSKAMNFRKLAFIDNTSNILSGVIALILALYGAGVWALVFNTVSNVFFEMPLFFNATKWKPSFKIDKKAFNDVFSFGAYATGSNVLNYLYNNIDYLLIGKLLGASSLGLYTLAFVLTDTFRSRLMSVINSVMYPMYGRRQNDFEALKRYYLKVVLFNCLFVFPVMIYFVVDGGDFVTHIFGTKWEQTVLPLQILAVSVMLHIMVSGNTALLRGLGYPGMEMKQQILKAAIFLPSLAIGIYNFGLVGAAWAILINKFLLVAVAQYTFYFLIPVRITVGELVSAIKAPLVASIAAAAITYALKLVGVNYIISGVILCAVYGGIIWMMMRSELKLLLTSFKNKQ
ncbi:MAG: lipopolysaccharide biosynthesis protein [Mucilaginibacter sp.]|nr:lipopolysaccharide biosynthesis protein [Mucilaginibacter sp.]